MAKKSAASNILDYRRELVARYRLQGATQREIVARLEADGVVNPTTDKPFSLGTINADVAALDAIWRAAAAADTQALRAEQLAELRLVRREAWRFDGLQPTPVITALVKALDDEEAEVRREAARALGQIALPDLDVVLKALKQAADLQGLPAPTKFAPTTPDGQALAPAVTGADMAGAFAARLAAATPDERAAILGDYETLAAAARSLSARVASPGGDGS